MNHLERSLIEKLNPHEKCYRFNSLPFKIQESIVKLLLISRGDGLRLLVAREKLNSLNNMPTYDSIYNYRIPGHNIDSQCRLIVPSLDSTPVISETIRHGIKVIVSELPDNPGMSICNVFKFLAHKICLEFEIDPHRLIYLEHWGKWSAERGGYDRETEEYSLVEFQVKDYRLYQPNWRYLLPADVNLLQQFLKLYQ